MAALALFVLFAAVALASAIGVIVQRNVMHSALALIATLCTMATLYLLLNAQFVAAAQLLTYAGAVIGLFLFAVMLTEQTSDARTRPRLTKQPLETISKDTNGGTCDTRSARRRA